MTVYIVFREDAYQGYSVREVFASIESAREFVNSEPEYEKGLLSIEEWYVQG